MSEVAPKKPSLKEAIAALPKVGDLVPVNIRGIGTVHVRVVSSQEMMELDEATQLDLIQISVMDENGDPLYPTAAALKKERFGVTTALRRAFDQVNSFSIEDAEKK